MKILVIDDEPLVRRSLLRAIQSRGHSGFEAEDGKRGLEVWRSCGSDLDLVFVDVLMPGLGGPDMLAQVLDPRNPPVLADTERALPYVVLMSAFSGEDSEKLAHDCGADRFLQKPFDDLFAILDQAISDAEARKRRRQNES